jgi:hypothetical protein
MNEDEAFLVQAQSDFAVFELLLDQEREKVPECHPLHLLQMSAEKLAKAFLIARQQQYPKSHAAFSSIMQLLRRGDIARRLGWSSFRSYREFIRRTHPLLTRIERLHPSLSTGPNVEYPWLSRDGTGVPVWVAPARHPFGLAALLRRPGEGQAFVSFLRLLLERFSEVTRSS